MPNKLIQYHVQMGMNETNEMTNKKEKEKEGKASTI